MVIITPACPCVAMAFPDRAALCHSVVASSPCPPSCDAFPLPSPLPLLCPATLGFQIREFSGIFLRSDANSIEPTCTLGRGFKPFQGFFFVLTIRLELFEERVDKFQTLSGIFLRSDEGVWNMKWYCGMFQTLSGENSRICIRLILGASETRCQVSHPRSPPSEKSLGNSACQNCPRLRSCHEA